MTEAPETRTFDASKPLWSIMTKSRGGTVSVIRGLTLVEAAKTYERLDPWYGVSDVSYQVHTDFLPDGCSFMGGCWSHRICSDGDIEIREVFGPEGWTRFDEGSITHWPKRTIVYTDRDGIILPDEYQTNIDIANRERLFRKERA